MENPKKMICGPTIARKATIKPLVLICACLALAAGLILMVPEAEAASFVVSPGSGSSYVGQTFKVNIYVSSSDRAMNAASGIVEFPTDLLECVSVSQTGSIFNFWVMEPGFSNTDGTVHFEGVVLNPGYTGDSGRVISLTFKVKAEGAAIISFRSGSILANDGVGTEIVNALGNARARYTLTAAPAASLSTPAPTPRQAVPVPTPRAGQVPLPPIIASDTHQDQNQWYADRNPKFNWVIPTGVTEVKASFDDKPDSNPITSYKPIIAEKQYKYVDDGIWYLHVQFRNSSGWSAVSNFKFQIDATPPEIFDISVEGERITSNPRPVLRLDASDGASGIDHYEIKIGNADTINWKPDSPEEGFRMPYQTTGVHYINAWAVDRAGNKTISREIVWIRPSQTQAQPGGTVGFIYNTALIASLLMAALLLFVIWLGFRFYRRVKHSLRLK